MEGRGDPRAGNLRLHDAVLGLPARRRLLGAMTVRAMSVQDAYIYGFALQQSDMSSETPEDFAAVARAADARLRGRAGRLSRTSCEVVGGYVAKAGYDYDAEFLFGLDLILDAPRATPRRGLTARGAAPG